MHGAGERDRRSSGRDSARDEATALAVVIEELAELRESARSQHGTQANANSFERYAELALMTVLADAAIVLAAEGVTGSGTRFIALEGPGR